MMSSVKTGYIWIIACMLSSTLAGRRTIIDSRFYAYTYLPESAKPDMIYRAVNGEDALLKCSIDKSTREDITSGQGHVVWMDKQDNVLYYNDARIIDDQRFIVITDADRSSWNLKIVGVTPKDVGRYRCVANTKPVIIKFYELQVFVPPQIHVETSSPHIEANEGSSVVLFCNVTGYPTPNITWTVKPANSNEQPTILQGMDGKIETLVVNTVQRNNNSIYTCMAENGYGRPVKHEINLRVRFEPKIKKMEGETRQLVGDTVTINCLSEGYPLPNMYFAKDNILIEEDDKYSYITDQQEGNYSKKLIFTVKNLQKEDFGYYKCVAVNQLGRVEKYVELLDKRVRSPITTVRNKVRPSDQEITRVNPTKRTPPPTPPRPARTTKRPVTKQKPTPKRGGGTKKGRLVLVRRGPENSSNKQYLSYTILFISAVSFFS